LQALSGSNGEQPDDQGQGQDDPPATPGTPRTGGRLYSIREEDLIPGQEPNIPRINRRETEGGGGGPGSVRTAQDSRGSDYFSQFGNAHVQTWDYGNGR